MTDAFRILKAMEIEFLIYSGFLLTAHRLAVSARRDDAMTPLQRP